MDGVLVVDKPSGWTSHDVVNKIRRIAGTRKVGHLGTLDPMATGVLPMVVGRATRLAQFFGAAVKEYDGVIRFGFATSTYDAEGEACGEDRPIDFTERQIEEWLEKFRGAILQTPPPVSAKKIAGRPAYELVRKKIAFDLPPVAVTIHRLELTHFAPPEISIRVECAAGTYVRSIAHDLGVLASCGAHLKSLRRVRSGDFGIGEARTLEALQELANEQRLPEAVQPMASLLPLMPAQQVDAVTADQIRHGRDFRVSPFRSWEGVKHVKALGPDGALLAIGEAHLPNVYHPVLVL